MGEQTWFEKMRADMLADIPHKTLHSQIFVNFDYDDLMKIDEILESFNHPESKDLDSFQGHKLPGIEVELAQATICEAVQMFDKHTMKKIFSKSTKKNFDLGKYKNEPIMDRYARIGLLIMTYFISKKPAITEDNISNCFIIANPMIISVLQSSPKAMFSPATEEEFKGPNNSMLVGRLNGIAVYSYLFGTDSDNVVMGYNDPETEDYHSHVINIENVILI